ncbi:cAMP-regulated phosphoprotein 19-A-like [Styela clava]|uniref:cAMP-regulated phosphoprotein 19-A-like n=1 Tax=Styela clava TaxID=7725 RepID=UPI00193A71CE|nr:cAMP-regulated phosphoprotein 19-A-like [Styela clava]
MSEGQQETGDFKKPATPPVSVEKQQEAMLMTKYKDLPPKKGGFLQQRLGSQKKFFDSGDYNMAKAKMGGKKIPAQVEPKEVTGDHMPTPDELPQVRKPSQSKLAMH